MKIIMGDSFVDNHRQVRIELKDSSFVFLFMNGIRDKSCLPYFGAEFSEDEENRFIGFMKQVILSLEEKQKTEQK